MITNLTEYLDTQYKLRPNKTVLADDERVVSFAELRADVLSLALCISKVTDDYNCPIIVFMEKGIWEYESLIGILYSGNHYVPLDIKMPIERLNKIINTLKAKIAVVSKKTESKLVEAGFSGKLIYAEDAFSKGCETEGNNGNVFLGRDRIIDTDPAYVLFTSGSTGTPKGVVVSHRAVIDYIEWQCDTFDFDEETVLGSQAPFYFDASMPDVYTPLRVGASLNIIPERLYLMPNKLVDYINEKEINSLIWVPSALVVLSKSGVMSNNKISRLKRVMFCGEVMPNKHLNVWRRLYTETEFVNLYGPTEAAYACTYYVVNREFKDEDSLPIGHGCKNTEILVLNDDNKPVTGAEEGELCIRGSSLANGYYSDSEKTDSAFVQNPVNSYWLDRIYRTGDIVKYNEYGELEYIGRKDFQIKHKGYRIELGEIEAATYGIDGMARACTVYSEKYETIVLFCEFDRDKTDEKGIYAYMHKKLPAYMMPGRIYGLEEMPMNANGKIDRKELKRMYEEELALEQ